MPRNLTKTYKKECFKFLDSLRESGECNLFGACTYLVDDFNLDKKDAVACLQEWMNNKREEKLQEDFELATFPILSTVDSGLIIKCKKNLIVNLNDTMCDPSKDFLKKEIII